MKERALETLKRSLVVCLAIAVATGPALAGSPPDNLSDLYYQEQSWTESQMRSRGYSFQHNDWHGSSLWQYWWNGGSHTCLQIEYDRKSKVAAMNTTSATDCGQYHEEATKNDKAAVIAIGAAALIGGLLAHKSHHRDGKHGDDSRSVAEFERGYRDGLHREDYHNYNNSDAYTDGYNKGVDERHEQTSYRSRQSGHSGYRSFVSVNDLVGARAAGADSQMRSRGFTDVGGYKLGNRSYVMWWNAQTRQCLQAATAEGRIESLESINEGNCQ